MCVCVCHKKRPLFHSTFFLKKDYLCSLQKEEEEVERNVEGTIDGGVYWKSPHLS